MTATPHIARGIAHQVRAWASAFACSLFVALLAGCASSGPPLTLPKSIQIGASADSLRHLLAQDCSRTTNHHYGGKEAAPFTRQLQIDCAGLMAFGAPRDVEFMFNDGPLGHVWVMVRADELKSLREKLEKAFGPIVYKTDEYVVFASGSVALRNQPPEVLVATPGMISRITGWKQDESK